MTSQLAVDVTARLGIPAGIVINRSDGKDQATLDFCTNHDLDVMMTIPFRPSGLPPSRAGEISSAG